MSRSKDSCVSTQGNTTGLTGEDPRFHPQGLGDREPSWIAGRMVAIHLLVLRKPNSGVLEDGAERRHLGGRKTSG